MTGQNDFEDLLKASLRRVEPPPGLQARILAAVRSRRARRRTAWLCIAAAVSLAVLAASLAVAWRRERLRAEQAEQARRQFEFAIQITCERLARLDRQLASIGVRRIHFEEGLP
jgi:hypothetical protein